MFLVDHDEPYVAQRNEERAACAHHHAGGPALHEVPLVVALALAHARMHDRHRVAEATAEAGNRLRRERDFGHEHDGVATCRERRLDGLQVHLGLARARHAVDEHHLAALRRARLLDRRERLLLTRREARLRRRNERFARRAALPLRHPAHAPAPLNAHDVLIGKRLDGRRHRTELKRELGHAQLASLERVDHRNLLHGVLARREIGRRRSERHPAVVDLAHRRFLEAPAALAHMDETGNAARRREETHARGERRDVALGEKTRAGCPLLIEVGL